MADVSVYAQSSESLQREAHQAATTAPWHTDDKAATWIMDNSTITVEHVELLGRGDSDSSG